MSDYVAIQSWAGIHRVPVKIIGETPKRFRVEILADAHWPGRCRTVSKGEVRLIPKEHLRSDNKSSP